MMELFLHLLKKMGVRFLLFRAWYAFKRKTGILKKQFPTRLKSSDTPSLDAWRKSSENRFFFNSRKEVEISQWIGDASSLYSRVEEMKKGVFTYFSGQTIDVGLPINWHLNPKTKYEYPKDIHWSKIPDFDQEKGDIKYVWELSRFCFIYDFIRYDQINNTDHSKWVFDIILNWIDENPLNQGPNYLCSQEISLRILNWTFALNYYSSASSLSDQVFAKIYQSIQGQYHHICKNIRFSKIAVRNNHAITETFAVWIIPILFPHFKQNKYSKKGKKWLEKEIVFQIFKDGTYTQNSHNYHRVVVQVLSWAIILGKRNKQALSSSSIKRIVKSLEFLVTCQDHSGLMANYGANDGALFFPLNNNKYRDYRPQIQALANALGKEVYDEQFEDTLWLNHGSEVKEEGHIQEGAFGFQAEGHLVIRDASSVTAMLARRNTRRPAQADALHLDIFYKGQNVLLDAGSYSYNEKPEVLNNFYGTNAHNTVSVDGANQMKKAGRFMWLGWSKCSDLIAYETAKRFVIEATLSGFEQVSLGIKHKRKVTKSKTEPVWLIEDTLIGVPTELESTLNWHLLPSFKGFISIESRDEKGNKIEYIKDVVAISEYYGVLRKADRLFAKTKSRNIITVIKIS